MWVEFGQRNKAGHMDDLEYIANGRRGVYIHTCMYTNKIYNTREMIDYVHGNIGDFDNVGNM